MTISEFIRPGDKIDLFLVQKIENSDKTDAEIYKSQVLDIRENGNLIISMPTEGGRLMLLPLGVRYELVFYAETSLYRAMGQIVERYKKENLYMLEVEMKTQLERVQRREFYRYNCTLDTTFLVLNEEQKAMESAEDIVRDLMDAEFKEKHCSGMVVDLSGGGMKLRSETKLQAEDKILIMLRLTNSKMDKQLQILGKVISCAEADSSKAHLFESRIQFLITDNKIRENIIRYIFEEERRIRQKENS